MFWQVPVSLDKSPLVMAEFEGASVLELRLYVLVETCFG